MSTCDHCGSAAIKLQCRKCRQYNFCSVACSDATALEHVQVCYDAQSTNPAYLQKHLKRANVELDYMHVPTAHALLEKAIKAQKKKAAAPRRARSKKPGKKSPTIGRGPSKSRSKSPQKKPTTAGKTRKKSPQKKPVMKKEKSKTQKSKPSSGTTRNDRSASPSPTFAEHAKDKARQFRDKASDFRNAVRQQGSNRASSGFTALQPQPQQPPLVVYRQTPAPQVVVVPEPSVQPAAPSNTTNTTNVVVQQPPAAQPRDDDSSSDNSDASPVPAAQPRAEDSSSDDDSSNV